MPLFKPRRALFPRESRKARLKSRTDLALETLNPDPCTRVIARNELWRRYDAEKEDESEHLWQSQFQE